MPAEQRWDDLFGSSAPSVRQPSVLAEEENTNNEPIANASASVSKQVRAPVAEPPIELTDEMRKRMQESRQKALERRRAAEEKRVCLMFFMFVICTSLEIFFNPINKSEKKRKKR